MSREQTSKQNKISIFGEIAKGCRTDRQKIEFFDSSKEAFFTESNKSKNQYVDRTNMQTRSNKHFR